MIDVYTEWYTEFNYERVVFKIKDKLLVFFYIYENYIRHDTVKSVYREDDCPVARNRLRLKIKNNGNTIYKQTRD